MPGNFLLGTCLNWSPDGRWLAVCDREDDSPFPLSVFLLSVDTGERRRLTSPTEGEDVNPAFSPDAALLPSPGTAPGLRAISICWISTKI